MSHYEYKVVPAPVRGEKQRGLKTGLDRFAHTLSDVMNAMAADGWEYLRAETLPAEERTGLTGKTTVFHNLLVFRRARDGVVAKIKGDADAELVVPAKVKPAPAVKPAAPEAETETGRTAPVLDAPEGAAPKLRAKRDPVN